MTATVGTEPKQAPAAPPVPATPERSASDDAERRRQLLQALTTEHFTLQTARAATIADSNGRSALYLATVSSAVVALAFIGQLAHTGQAFLLFALALLPALVLLGVLTYLRLVQTAVEDLFYARAINRIRATTWTWTRMGDAGLCCAASTTRPRCWPPWGWPPRAGRIPAGTCCRMRPPWWRWSPASSAG
jgi:hypothetical protein